MFCKVLRLQVMLLLPLSMIDGDVTKLWHMRFGHMSDNGMIELSRKGLLDGQTTCKSKFCEHFVFRKKRRVKIS